MPDRKTRPPAQSPSRLRGVRRPSRRALAFGGIAVLVTLLLKLKDGEYADAAWYAAVVPSVAYLSTRSEEFYGWMLSRPRIARHWEAGLVLVGVVLALRYGGVLRILPALGLLIMSVRLHLGFRKAQRSPARGDAPRARISRT